MKKAVVVFFSSFLVLILMAGATATFLGWQYSRSPGSTDSRDVIYEIPPGKAFNSIARELEMSGVVQNASFFTVFSRLTGDRARIKAGEYLLNTSMTPAQVLAVITSGKSVARPFTVSEGLNVFEISELYNRSGFGTVEQFLNLARDPAFAKSLLGEDVQSLEGYLFPETYQVTKHTTTRELITAMVRRFQAVWAEVEPRSRIQGLNRHQVVTLASIIEKETGAPHERPLISSVFHNRMGKRMRLQTDPTIIYGIADETGVVPKNIRKVDILRPTKYNTYVISGLPPGPIANAGREALLAAVNPASSDFLFFVSQNDGTHVFSSTYEEHNAAVRKFQLDRRAREGKSWRDLNRKTGP